MNDIRKTSGEIREALATMETPHFCNDCRDFYDSGSCECTHCGSLDTEDPSDLLYHLEVAQSHERKAA